MQRVMKLEILPVAKRIRARPRCGLWLTPS
jgi:hypothetical protein